MSEPLDRSLAENRIPPLISFALNRVVAHLGHRPCEGPICDWCQACLLERAYHLACEIENANWRAELQAIRGEPNEQDRQLAADVLEPLINNSQVACGDLAATALRAHGLIAAYRESVTAEARAAKEQAEQELAEAQSKLAGAEHAIRDIQAATEREIQALRSALERIKARHSPIEVSYQIADNALALAPPAQETK